MSITSLFRIMLLAVLPVWTGAAPLTPLSPFAQSLNRPLAPFRIADEIYYVGTNDLGIYLITTPAGDILIDGGFEQTVPQILANLHTLGVDPRRIRILLNSHEHYDHAGGLAALKRLTGARLLASRAAAAAFARGGRDDPQWGNAYLFPSVVADGTVEDGTVVALGGVRLVAHLTPGHTKGCTTWTMQAHIAGQSYAALFLCSVSAPGYRLVGNPAYPGIVADYEHSFAVLKSLPCELFLGAHGSFFDLAAKRAAMLKTGSPLVFVDAAGCRRYLDEAEAGFRRQLTAQRH